MGTGCVFGTPDYDKNRRKSSGRQRKRIDFCKLKMLCRRPEGHGKDPPIRDLRPRKTPFKADTSRNEHENQKGWNYEPKGKKKKKLNPNVTNSGHRINDGQKRGT